MLFVNSFTTSCTIIREFDNRRVILFQIKVFAGDIKETMLATYISKVTARPSFTRLRLIRRKNRIHQISKLKRSYKDSVVSSYYLNLLAPTPNPILHFFDYSLWIFSLYRRNVLSEWCPSAIVNQIIMLVRTKFSPVKLLL